MHPDPFTAMSLQFNFFWFGASGSPAGLKRPGTKHQIKNALPGSFEGSWMHRPDRNPLSPRLHFVVGASASPVRLKRPVTKHQIRTALPESFE